jgi:epoxyqueuosine reductase QueG
MDLYHGNQGIMSERSHLIKSIAKQAGADLAGIADLAVFRGKLPTVPDDLLAGYRFAFSAAVRLDDAIVSAIADHPTLEYAELYRQINKRLDGIAARVVEWIEAEGSHARAVQASAIMEEERLLGGISHKAVARMAGLGWQGKSLLLVSPEYGPRVRLVTVLTDLPLLPDGPIGNRCGTCQECINACPAGAIRNVRTESHYETREQAVVLEKCHALVKTFAARQGIGARICGVCVRACPWGNKKKR